MVEFNIHAILRAQQRRPPNKPVEIDYVFDFLLLMAIWAWGIGHTYGEVIMEWLKK